MNSICYRVAQVQRQINSQGIETNQGKMEVIGTRFAPEKGEKNRTEPNQYSPY